jgi:peptidoglycan L-alanyl-D-glutamate endopeptidase CwlK
MAADQITIERIKTLHPKIRKEVSDMYNYVNDKLLGKGVRLRFAYTYRTPEEQDKLFKQKPKVTNAKAWQSVHQYGLALDIVLLLDKNNDNIFEEASWDTRADWDKDKTPDWSEVRDHFKSKGWVYGGDWKSFKDYPHFEKTFGLTVSQMKSKIDNKDYILENNIKYINI